MRSDYFSYLSQKELNELVSAHNYAALKQAAANEKIRVHEFSAVIRGKFSNDFSNPGLSALFEGLWLDNDNLKSITFITERLYYLLAIQMPNQSIFKLITTLMKSADTLIKSIRLYGMLASYKMNQIVLPAIEKLSPEEKITALNHLIEHAVYKCNISLLQQIESTYPQQMQTFLRNENHAQLENIITRARIMLETEDPKDSICLAMHEFTQGPGKISYEGGLLTCARISSEGKYAFNPTIINRFGTGIEKPLDDYFQALSEIPLPIHERFIISDFHWACGDIKVDENGNISVLLIDSLGSCIDTADTCYQLLHKFFPNANITIYTSYEKRQYSDSGCSVFALDDVKQLFTIEEYLEPRYQDTGLYGYLADHIAKDRNYAHSNIKKCDLPIKFLRLTQTRSLFSQMLPERSISERALVINKKGETALESSKKSLVEDKNQRMNMKLLITMANKNADYLLKTDPETVKRAKHAFTIEGFRERVQTMKAQKKFR